MSLVRLGSLPSVRHAALPLSLAAALLALPACDGGGGETKPTVASVEASGRGGDVQVKAPESIKGGLVRMEFKNSAREPLDAQLVRVDGNKSVDQVLRVIQSDGGPIPAWLHGAGGVGATEPGQTRFATQALPPGRYYVISQAEEGRGKPASTAFRAEGGGADAKPPSAPATITAREYTFDVSGLKPGRNEVRFENAGRELHHVVGAPMRQGADLDDVRRFVTQERPSGRPPLDIERGFTTAVIDGGIEQVVEVDLEPGKYAMVCFIQDRKGGLPHVMKGMMKEVDVK